MVDEYIILLQEFKFGNCGLVNQFLIDTGLSNDFRVVLAEYERPAKEYVRGAISVYETAGKVTVKERCIGLEALNEKSAFIWGLKGHKEMIAKLKEYQQQNTKRLL